MQRLPWTGSFLAAALVAGIATTGRGQIASSESDAAGAVSGTGLVTLKRQPETLRMFVEISAKGKNLKEALEKLKERREVAEKRLIELGATKDTIKVESPKIPPVDVNRQRQLQQMVQMRMRERGKRAVKKTETAKPVIVNASVTADFPLKADDAENLLLSANTLEDKIRKAELSGAKDKEESTAEDEEMAEEMAEMNPYDESAGAKPGEPNFVFVAKISAEERTKALSSAFDKAKTQAQQVAAAAGAKLGNLRRVASHSLAGRGGFDESYAYQQMGNAAYRRMMMQMQSQQMDGGEQAQEANEAFAAQAGDVQFPITVTAEFSLK